LINQPQDPVTNPEVMNLTKILGETRMAQPKLSQVQQVQDQILEQMLDPMSLELTDSSLVIELVNEPSLMS